MISIFHSKLIQFINTGSLSKVDYILSLTNRSKLFNQNASKLIELYQESLNSDKTIQGKSQNIKVKTYSGNNSFVMKMMKSLETDLNEHLYGAYLHGSLATQEEIKYSDFDALVILKDAVFEDQKKLSIVAQKLNRLLQVMQEYDPLQHHGWFVLTESMLQNHPSTYFPAKLFNYSASLLYTKGLDFDLSYSTKELDFDSPFWRLSNELSKKLKHNYRPLNSFSLKSFLSEFMLLPALYLQLKNKEAVYKKDSFDLARKDFSDQEWMIMDQVSEVRQDWSYEISWIQRILLTHRNSTIRKLSRKYAPPVSNLIKEKLTNEFYAAMSSFVLSMQAKVKSL